MLGCVLPPLCAVLVPCIVLLPLCAVLVPCMVFPPLGYVSVGAAVVPGVTVVPVYGFAEYFSSVFACSSVDRSVVVVDLFMPAPDAYRSPPELEYRLSGPLAFPDA